MEGVSCWSRRLFSKDAVEVLEGIVRGWGLGKLGFMWKFLDVILRVYIMICSGWGVFKGF